MGTRRAVAGGSDICASWELTNMAFFINFFLEALPSETITSYLYPRNELVC